MSNNVITREYIYSSARENVFQIGLLHYTQDVRVHVHRVEIIRKSTIMLLIILEI